MLVPLRRDWRDLGRPTRARFHCHPEAGCRSGAQRHALLAGPARRHREFERCADALAHRERAVAGERTRSTRAGLTCIPCRVVQGTGFTARSMEHYP